MHYIDKFSMMTIAKTSRNDRELCASGIDSSPASPVNDRKSSVASCRQESITALSRFSSLQKAVNLSSDVTSPTKASTVCVKSTHQMHRSARLHRHSTGLQVLSASIRQQAEQRRHSSVIVTLSCVVAFGHCKLHRMNAVSVRS